MEKRDTVRRHLAHGLIVVAVTLIVAVIAMWLWNCLVPTITGWSTITYLQTLGLMLLGRLLTGGLGTKWHMHKSGRQNEALRNQFAGMSKEEKRAYLKQYYEAKQLEDNL